MLCYLTLHLCLKYPKNYCMYHSEIYYRYFLCFPFSILELVLCSVSVKAESEMDIFTSLLD